MQCRPPRVGTAGIVRSFFVTAVQAVSLFVITISCGITVYGDAQHFPFVRQVCVLRLEYGGALVCHDCLDQCEIASLVERQIFQLETTGLVGYVNRIRYRIGVKHHCHLVVADIGSCNCRVCIELPGRNFRRAGCNTCQKQDCDYFNCVIIHLRN